MNFENLCITNKILNKNDVFGKNKKIREKTAKNRTQVYSLLKNAQ